MKCHFGGVITKVPWGNHEDVLPSGIPQPGRREGRLQETTLTPPSGLTGGPDAVEAAQQSAPQPSHDCRHRRQRLMRCGIILSTDNRTTIRRSGTGAAQLWGSISRKEGPSEDVPPIRDSSTRSKQRPPTRDDPHPAFGTNGWARRRRSRSTAPATTAARLPPFSAASHALW